MTAFNKNPRLHGSGATVINNTKPPSRQTSIIKLITRDCFADAIARTRDQANGGGGNPVSICARGRTEPREVALADKIIEYLRCQLRRRRNDT
jgi:hypothetical protein